MIVWNRRSSAPSFSMYLRYSSIVVAPMHWISPRDSAGLSTLAASIAPSAPPAPTSVCSSSMNRMTLLGAPDLVHDGLDALLELPAVLRAGHHHRQVQDDDPPVVQDLRHVVARRSSGASPSTIAVLPTPASPSSTGLFFVRRQSTCITRSISSSRPMTGSSLPSRARSVRSRPKLSSAGVLLLACRLRAPAHPRAAASSGSTPAPEEIQDFLADLFQLEAQVHQHLGGHAFAARAAGPAAGARCRRSCGRGCGPPRWRTR